MNYQKGYFEGFVEAVKRDVRLGILTKEDAVKIILGKAQEILLNLKVDTKQFMLDREMEVSYERN